MCYRPAPLNYCGWRGPERTEAAGLEAGGLGPGTAETVSAGAEAAVCGGDDDGGGGDDVEDTTLRMDACSGYSVQVSA